MHLRSLFLLSTALAASLSLSSCAMMKRSSSSATGGPPTVEQVDLKRYSGTWYEIGRYPHSFEKGATHVTATYTPLEDGSIKVENRSTKNGKPNNIEGTATVVEGSNGAKLKVKFFPFLPAGNYWIIGLDEKDYQWAMVGEGSRKYFWILSRKPKMDERFYESLLAKAEAMGYDRAKVELVDQD